MTELGALNVVYRGSLTDGANGRVSPQAMYPYLIGQGASKGEALMLTGAAASESEFNPTVTHDGGKGYGMFGHNDSRLLATRDFRPTQRAVPRQ